MTVIPLRTKTLPSVWLLLDRERDALDGLIAELELGPRDQRHFEALEERGQAIAARIIAAFRGKSIAASSGQR